jgi:hypothetical protein
LTIETATLAFPRVYLATGLKKKAFSNDDFLVSALRSHVDRSFGENSPKIAWRGAKCGLKR